MSDRRTGGRSGPLVRSLRAVGRGVSRPPAALGRRIRRVTHAQGAGESGLGKLIEVHAVHSMGDMLITMALASTIFFSVPTDEARGRVALYLAVTMAPFVLLAPVIGPLLDRIPHGRRAAMAGALLFRGVLALLITGAVATGELLLYPAALGVMVASKAYNIVRAAVVPRLLPQKISLVKANARITLTGLISAGVAAPLGLLLHLLGPQWPLYGAFVLTTIGAVMCFRLPHKVDLAKGERALHLEELARTRVVREPERGTGRNGGRRSSRDGAARASRNGGPRRTRGPVAWWRRRSERRERVLRAADSPVFKGLIANSSLRVLSGFLLFFLAFLLRDQPLPGMSTALALGVVGVAAGAGNGLGNVLGAWARDRAPEVILLLMLGLAVGTSIAAAVAYGTVTVLMVSTVAGLGQAMGKLSLDAMIQRDVPEVVRTSAFARSETVVQMAWVVGGAFGIALPLIGWLGMTVVAVLLIAGTAASAGTLLASARRGTPHPRVR
ncbi:MFS transporter [Streptomyces calidiresistens]|uniref:MFS transporter n=1 Tax=Streptomyces calidiresistens TaxID=1485586 RepID=A0A7W3XXI8_9ACTN|nr:MFS transporter [Streptomyces calidiresistens]MBB0230872.1 MFS transporter [Streptomyces calidiresistens]